MFKTQTFKKTEPVVWQHFSRRGDSIFRSLGREIRIAVLSVATLAHACPDTAAASMAYSHEAQTGEATAATEAREGEEPDVSTLLHGDLLFTVVSQQRDGLARAIVSVTEGKDLQQVSHVAIVCREPDGMLYALEASGSHGVWLNPIHSFLEQCDHTPEGRPMVLVGRLKDRSVADASVARARRYLGRPYDYQYLPGDSAIYCSELVHYAYLDRQGRELFPQQPMSFHDASGEVTPFWRDYYRRWNMDVPEGWPGTNPGGISRSDKIEVKPLQLKKKEGK